MKVMVGGRRRWWPMEVARSGGRKLVSGRRLVNDSRQKQGSEGASTKTTMTRGWPSNAVASFSYRLRRKSGGKILAK